MMKVNKEIGQKLFIEIINGINIRQWSGVISRLSGRFLLNLLVKAIKINVQFVKKYGKIYCNSTWLHIDC
jgi:hypothetical protein